MARLLNRLSPRGVAAEKRTGRHADGGGLYLSISGNGGKRWVFLFRRNGRAREMGLEASAASLWRVPVSWPQMPARWSPGVLTPLRGVPRPMPD